MKAISEIVEAIKSLLSTGHPAVGCGLFLVEQFGENAGDLLEISLSDTKLSLSTKARKSIRTFLMDDGPAPRSQSHEYDLFPINGDFGRAIGYLWVVNFESSSNTIFSSAAKLIALSVDGEKKARFHEEFQQVISESSVDDIFFALQRTLEKGLFARKVVVWELDGRTLKSTNHKTLDIPTGRGFVQKALDGEIHRIHSVENYKEDLYLPEFFEKNNIKSAFAFPIRNHFVNDPSPYLGVIGVFYKRPNGITSLDERLCSYAVDYFGLIWSLHKRIQNKEKLITGFDISESFLSQAANALVDYHDINTIQIGLANSIENAKLFGGRNDDIVFHLSNAQERLAEIRKIIENNRSILSMARDFTDHFDINTDNEINVCDVVAVVQHEIDDIRTELHIDRANLYFKSHLNNSIVRISVGDLKRVVRNLISNALRSIKLRRQGGGRVDVLVYNPTPKKLGIRVHDNGPGIEPGIGELIFQPFYTTHAQQGGRGLGLYAVESIAKKHGDRPRVKTKWGYYAEFEVWLNLE